MRTILHVGPPKTGSSYVQSILNHNPGLLEAAGWLYPAAGRTDVSADHRLLAYQSEDYLTPGLPGYQALHDLRDADRNLIFSAEGMVYWPAERFYTLVDLIGAEEVEILFYLRDPFTVFYSTWRERVKHGYLDSLPEYFMVHFADPSNSPLMNPTLTMRKLANLGPRFKLTVLSYDKLRAEGTDIVDHLWGRMLGIEKPFKVKREAVNASFDIEVSEFLRLMLQEYRFRDPGIDLNRLRQIFTQLFNASSRNNGKGPLGIGADRSYATRIRDAFEDLETQRQRFEINRHTGVHSYIRNECAQDFAAHMPHPLDPAEVYDSRDVVYEYFNTEDMRRSAKIMRLVEDIMSAVDARKARQDSKQMAAIS